MWSSFNAKHFGTYFNKLLIRLLMRGGLDSCPCCFEKHNRIKSMLEIASASKSCASMMLHIFSILRGPASCLTRCFYRIHLKGSPGTTSNFLWRMKWRPVLLKWRQWHPRHNSLSQTRFCCRSRKGWCARSSPGPLQYSAYSVSNETDWIWVVTFSSNSVWAFTTSQNMALAPDGLPWHQPWWNRAFLQC